MSSTGRTKVLFRGNSAAAGSTISTQRQPNVAGTVHIDFSSATTWDCTIEGRASSELGWVILATLDEAQEDANGQVTRDVTLFPQMRLNLSAETGTPGVDTMIAYLIE